jgi:outer membrane protein assembly factor BamA
MRLLAILAIAVCAASGQTRTSKIEEAREVKSGSLKPESVSRLEAVMLEVKQRKLIERITAGYNGLRVKLGAMATGSGFAFGPEIAREELGGGSLRFDASALISTRRWQKYQAGIGMPRAAGGLLSLRLDAVRRDYRSLEFYGTGPESTKGGRSVYRLVDTTLQGSAGVQPVRHVRFGAILGGLWTEVDEGRRSGLASTASSFNESSAPGLTRQANFVRPGVFGQIDYRDDPAGPKAGGNYVVQHTWYRDQSLGSFNFGRWDVDVQQYVPFFNRTRRLALRARLTMTDSAAGQQVPFYLQPYVGGADDLRGFRPYRFTDRNAVVYNAEYRWEVFSGLDGAVFFDAGKVMPHRGWLNVSDLETSAGFGLRFNARNRTFMRIDAGFSHEGFGLWIKFNDPFLPRVFGTGVDQPLY